MEIQHPILIDSVVHQPETIVVTVENTFTCYEPWDETQDDLISIYNQAKELNYA